MIKAIQTRYKGYRFRSRLEARWAVFFDNLPTRWEYEPQGYDLGEHGWYLPDFYLPDIRDGIFVEVKPSDVTLPVEDIYRFFALSIDAEKTVLVVQGVPSDAAYEGVDHLDPNWKHGEFRFTVTEEFGVSLSLVTRHGPTDDMTPHHAIEAARSARFEHGETPK